MIKEFITISFLSDDIYADLEKRVRLEFLMGETIKRVNLESYLNANFLFKGTKYFFHKHLNLFMYKCELNEETIPEKIKAYKSIPLKKIYEHLESHPIMDALENLDYHYEYGIGYFFYAYTTFNDVELQDIWWNNFRINRYPLESHYREVLQFLLFNKIPKFLFKEMAKQYADLLRKNRETANEFFNNDIELMCKNYSTEIIS